jgi:head-tail adaptor
MPTPAGLKNQLVTVERLREKPTRLGENKSTSDAWAAIGQPIWANVKSVVSSESNQDGRVQATVIYTVTMDAFHDVRAADRLRFGTRILGIQGIKPRGLRNEEHEITCIEEVQ